MHPEKYSLAWHAYSEHLKSMMKELMLNEDLSDVTLVTEDKKQFKANINILSAFSPVFKDTLKKDKNSSPIMYLRGVQFSELESILQFIYLGEATFYKERMDEFLAVAKLLEIKELSEAETETNNKPDDDLPPVKKDTSTELVEENTDIFEKIKEQDPRERHVHVTGKYECDKCRKTYSGNGELKRHRQSAHQGVKHACDQCDKSYSDNGDLNKHKQSVHHGVTYVCDQCVYQASHPSNLRKHVKSKHGGVKYFCNQCDYQAIEQGKLKLHIQAKHEGVRYNCDQCNYQANTKGNLKKHIDSKHEGLK